MPQAKSAIHLLACICMTYAPWHASCHVLKYSTGSQPCVSHVKTLGTIHLLTWTYLEFYLLEVEHTDLWELVDDIEPVMLLVCHWIPQQAGKSVITNIYDHNSVDHKRVWDFHIRVLMDDTWGGSVSSLWPVGPSHPVHREQQLIKMHCS